VSARPDTDREACDRAVAATRAQLVATAGEVAWSEGAAMTLEQAIANACNSAISRRRDDAG